MSSGGRPSDDLRAHIDIRRASTRDSWAHPSDGTRACWRKCRLCRGLLGKEWRLCDPGEGFLSAVVDLDRRPGRPSRVILNFHRQAKPGKEHRDRSVLDSSLPCGFHLIENKLAALRLERALAVARDLDLQITQRAF